MGRVCARTPVRIFLSRLLGGREHRTAANHILYRVVVTTVRGHRSPRWGTCWCWRTCLPSYLTLVGKSPEVGDDLWPGIKKELTGEKSNQSQQWAGSSAAGRHRDFPLYGKHPRPVERKAAALPWDLTLPFIPNT